MQVFDLAVGAAGSFRPGQPVTIRAAVRALRGLGDVELDVTVLDDPNADPTAASATSDVRQRRGPRLRLKDWHGPLARGARTQLVEQVTFAEPGYYKVLVRAFDRSTSSPSEAEPDSSRGLPRQRFAYRVLHVLIEETGGRAAERFDSTVVRAPGRALLYGQYGPFRRPRPRGLVPAGAPAGGRSPAAAGPLLSRSGVGAASMSSGGFTGYLYYQDYSQFGVPIVGVAGARIVLGCTSSSGTYELSTVTDADGYFVEPTCYGLDQAYSRYAYYENQDVRFNEISNISGVSADQPVQQWFVNAEQAHTWTLLNIFVPRAKQAFQRSRPQLEVSVQPSASGLSNFSSYNNRISINGGGAFDRDGFVVLHEYGHAFQWRAIDPWRAASCGDGHAAGEVINLGCAYVEGFADFFAAWLLAPLQPINDEYSAYSLERNNWRTRQVDNSKDEGPVAALFLDMIDGPGDPWTQNGIDDDGVKWPVKYLGDLMQKCDILYRLGTTSYRWEQDLNGIDEMLYCGEDSYTHPRQANPFNSWRTAYGQRDDAINPPGWSPAVLRQLWRSNFYPWH